MLKKVLVSVNHLTKGCIMIQKSILGFGLLSLFLFLCWPIKANCLEIPDYKNANLPIEKRVEDLLSRMTLKEKVAQLQCYVRPDALAKIGEEGIGGLGCILRPYSAREAAKRLNEIQSRMVNKTRLGIPVIMHDEALHGLLGNKATSFPQSIAMAATWDPDLVHEVAKAIAKEVKSRGIRQALSPTINIARDVRWGRTEETYGEDPYLTSRMGVAFCKAFEEMGVVTTPKHYAANIGDGGRDSNPVHFSERLMREIYLPGFEACIREAGARSIMSAYNSYDGTPCSSNQWLLTDLLRKEWGFQGFVVSDYGAVSGILYMHHTAATPEETAAQALSAGLDVELPNVEMYGEALLEAIKKGLVSEEILNEAVRRVLRVKFQLGLFENPFADPEEADRVNDCAEHRALARKAGQKAIVLLKNENNLLPLSKSIKSIAVIGPLANTVRLGGYSGWGMKTVSLLEGIQNTVPNAKIYSAPGLAALEAMGYPPIPSEYLFTPDEKQNGLLGEYYDNAKLEGEPVLVRIDKSIEFNWGDGSPDPKLKPDRFSVRWTGKLKAPVSGSYRLIAVTDDGVRIFINGKKVTESWIDRAPSPDFVPIRFEKGKLYDIKIEYYENSVGASAFLCWDVSQKDTEKSLREAMDLVKQAEVAIVAVGIHEGEGRDRAEIALPIEEEKLILSTAATGKPTVVVLFGGSAIDMRNWIHKVDAVVEAWYLGEETGNALADVLFGDVNPGGKLPITFPFSSSQCPLYYNTKPTGRGYDYVDMSGRPLFPFGYGLSYTTFEYANLQLSKNPIQVGETVEVTVNVKNTGSRAGDEVVQLYIHDVVGSVSRPLKELKGFKRISLAPNETQTVTFQLTPEHLSMYNKEMKKVIEPGEFEILVGSSSADIRLKTTLTVK